MVSVIKPITITENEALHLRAIRTFTDIYGKTRKAGEEWLITLETTESHIIDVYEEKVAAVQAKVLSNVQYCVINEPIGPDGVNQLGT